MLDAAADPAFAAPAPSSPVSAGGRPSFSVIMAAWQAAAVIGTAIRSALAQTEPPHEIVVCDDGSTDDLAGALAPFGDAVRFLHVAHSGGGAASNAAAAAATGDFVVVLDADDSWHPRRLQRIGDLAAARPDLDLLTTDAWFVVDGQRRGRFYEANTFETQDQATEILRRTFFFSHVAIRRSRWNEVGGFAPDLRRGKDWDLQLRLLWSGSRAGCVLEPLADYVIHGASLSASRYESLMARVEVLDRAAATQPLTATQRAVLERAQQRYRRRALAARAEHALLTGSPGRRRDCLALARASRGMRSRLRVAAAVVAPGWAARRLRRDIAEHGRSRSERAVPLGGSTLDSDDE